MALVVLLVSLKKARDVIGIITHLNDKPFALMAVFFENMIVKLITRGS